MCAIRRPRGRRCKTLRWPFARLCDTLRAKRRAWSCACAILAGDRDIGTLIAVEGNKGLAVVRIDKAGAAMGGGTPIMLAGQAVALTLPAWSGLDFPAEADEAAS